MFDENKNNLTPLTGFWCLPNGQFDDTDRRVLTDLYLPLIGSTAFGIYQLLWEKVPHKTIITDRESHSNLMALLDMDINTFYTNRLKLEGLGLLKTYFKTDELGEFNIYQIFPPLAPEDFFKDDLMSIFLLEKIGETQYNALVNKYYRSTEILQGAKNVSKDFMDVFKLNDNDLLNKPNAVQAAQSGFKNTVQTNAPKIKLDTNSELDLSLIEDRVSQLFKISHDDLLKNQQLLLSLHEFYGVDEVTLIDLIGETTDIVDNTIDPDALKHVVLKRFENKANVHARVVQAPIQSDPQRTNSTNPETILLNRAKSTPPADFLADEKNQLGGFTGNSEARALRTLSSRSMLPNPVLNIMVHYILQTSPTLTLPLMETIANDWKQNGVKTAEDALKRITDFQNRPRNTNNRRFSGGPKKIEQATDWNKVQSKPANNGDESQAEKARLEMLRKLRNKEN